MNRGVYILTIGHEDYLEHYGVKGMKWGVRKDRPSLSSRIRKARSNRKAREISKRSPERRAVDKIQTKKKAKYMTDNELKTVINRLNLEAQYNRLTLEVYSPGKKFAKDFLTKNGGKSVDAITNRYVIKRMRG